MRRMKQRKKKETEKEEKLKEKKREKKKEWWLDSTIQPLNNKPPVFSCPTLTAPPTL